MLTVPDVMTRGVIAVRPETPLAELARLLVEHRISGVPVTDASGAVVGVVSEADFLVKEQGAEAVHHRPLARFFGESGASRARIAKIAAVTAGEAMTSPAVTVEPASPISEAAGRMSAQGVNRLPVVDELLRALWLDPASFTIAVSDGVVSISGSVERRSTAEMIERVIAMVPGVMAVRADLRWTQDDSRIRPATIDPFFPHSPG